jgi:hypothetical protein
MRIDAPNPSQYKREPFYRNVDMPHDVLEILDNPKYGWIRSSLPFLMLNPSLSVTRQYFSDALWRMYNHSEEIKRESNFTDDDIYGHVRYLESVLTVFGFCSQRDLERMRPSLGKKGEILLPVDPSQKYKTYDELKRITQELTTHGKVVGIVHGCFDPGQVGHLHLASEIFPYCDIVLCGFQKNSQISEAKGADRPRFPQLAWRMWEMASSPAINYVFVLPTTSYYAGEEITEIYRDLGVTVLGAGYDNPLLPVYEERMQKLGGKVIANKYRWSRHSSTLVMKYVEDPTATVGILPRMILEAQVTGLDKRAKRAGYLRDYPDGT